jgi:hypothetical protein
VNRRCVEQEPQARARQGAQKVAGAGPRGPNLATEKQSREARAARARAGCVRKHGVEVRAATGAGRGADKAATAATRLLLVPARGRVTTSSSPTRTRRGRRQTNAVLGSVAVLLVL